ncbi:hypothetical protein BN1723_008323 [Verticillium longisporum]|nr:hypothetical protein BN1723_008323 [Verticillium longisporum]
MPPRIPVAKGSETLCYGAATVAALAPLYFMIPGAEQRLASQTAKWAPRWERNISYFTPSAERGIKRSGRCWCFGASLILIDVMPADAPLTMPPRIPVTKGSETLCYGAATVAALAPLYFMIPGAEQRLASQTAKWAPRWERNISYFTPSAERGIKRVEPPVARTVQAMERRLPLEKMAKGMERRINNGIDRFNNVRK